MHRPQTEDKLFYLVTTFSFEVSKRQTEQCPFQIRNKRFLFLLLLLLYYLNNKRKKKLVFFYANTIISIGVNINQRKKILDEKKNTKLFLIHCESLPAACNNSHIGIRINRCKTITRYKIAYCDFPFFSLLFLPDLIKILPSAFDFIFFLSKMRKNDEF